MKAATPLLALLLSSTTWASADTPESATAGEGRWAIGFTTRLQSSPYIGEGLRTDFLPELYYQGEAFYLDGTRAGWRTSAWDGVTFDLFGEYRFGGYNGELTQEIPGMRRYGTLEAGATAAIDIPVGQLRLTVRADTLNRHGGHSVDAEWRGQWQGDKWRLEPFVAAEFENADVNQYYYGVDAQDATPERPAYTAGAATNFSVGADAWYRLGQAHLLGVSLAYTQLDSTIDASPLTDSGNRVDARFQYRYEFLNSPVAQTAAKAADNSWLKEGWEWRLAGGYWKDGNFIEMIYLNNMAVDTKNTAMVSGFLSKKISDEVWGLPIEAHATAGLVRHFEKGEQDNFNEYVIAIKGYFNQFPWSHIVETRVGFGYGFSYAAQVPWQESDSVLEKNENDSPTLQYLDYSWDVNVGDLFRTDAARHCYAGYSIHHRSGIFGKTDVYNRVNGGSNWNTFYLQCKIR
ncbi:MipA/OmpV family protein [Simiduia agarivorans]|uniref:MltA-interacting MipA family protein n=1 Tax=Simiduia agarivorans (strain DSM 21679 / JCM 13881 / BCRC 17597 / SA1) TaxID=1117647 RepID=K4KIJ6_SIMAS|nr:MipA/OmpV family protein [Simiduia agarivorans]AFU98846.1 hypothetical protein M5M_08285 [Simiduia agarivorans SA1 = DSM 21679]